MKQSKIGNTQIVRVGLGTWQLGSADWGFISPDNSLEILDAFVKRGGDFIDTADVYGGGTSEKIIGRYIQESGAKVNIATKLGRRSDNEYGWPDNFQYDAMLSHVEDSLKRLKQDRLFLEQLHCVPTEELQRGYIFDNLRRLQDDGLIEHWGASVESVEEALICLEEDGISSLQIIFNVFRQRYIDEVLPLALEKGVAVIARVPLASGLLTGKFSINSKFGFDDHRHYNANGEYFNVGETFSGLPFDEALKLVDECKGILPQGIMAQLALRWALDHEAISVVIPGASSVKQVDSNMSALGLEPLKKEVHEKLFDFYSKSVEPHIRGEI